MKEIAAIEHMPRLDPDGLMRLMSWVAVLSLLVILSLAGYGIHRVFTAHVIHNAEETAVGLSELLSGEGRLLLDKSGRLTLSAPNRERLDHRLRTLSAPFDVVKIKIYDATGKILYSTDPGIVGQIDSGNPRLAKALAGRVDSRLESRETVLDLAEEQQFDVDVVETYVPILDDHQIAGCFELYMDVTRYREEIRRGVLAATGLLALILVSVFTAAFLVVRQGVLQLRQAQEQLTQLASIDPLTGAFNRGEILNRARKEASRLRRAMNQSPEQAIALVMVDIDRFRAINDRHGHLVGDTVLRQVVRRIKIELRDYDLFGRYGGEEFLAVLPGTDAPAAVAVAERMRRAVGETPFDVDGLSLPVTISLGVAVLAGEILDLTGTLQRADEALSRAKHTGRDRVCCTETDSPPEETLP
ncbi:MAG: GGDEF domain-containing protein [Trichloromonas sp.]|jgi:diguanylate cyclase (GGDEF)-like protein|nr:GGDEF domain-containing protein [Trichloromonas sp.]